MEESTERELAVADELGKMADARIKELEAERDSLARVNASLVAALKEIAELEGDCENQQFNLTRFQASQVARAALAMENKQMLKEETVESHCHAARQLIQQAQVRIRDAAYQAGTDKNYELDKTITALDATLGGVILILISAPRLKG